jgi:serine/threonine protein kinase
VYLSTGVNHLHGLGFAHTDIRVDNMLVDSAGVVFVGDLEYVVPLASPARRDGRAALPREQQQTAQHQDMAQLALLEAEVTAL